MTYAANARNRIGELIGKLEHVTYIARLQERYVSSIRGMLLRTFSYKNVMQVPKLYKIVVSMGVKEAIVDSKVINDALDDLMLITGQKPVVTRAKKAISTFKVRKGMPVGCKVTLRGCIMYEFLDRLVNVALPRVKDFRGISPKQFDGKGNCALGLKEQIVFPEIPYDKVGKIRGLNVVFVTTAKTDVESKVLLQAFDVPFIS